MEKTGFARRVLGPEDLALAGRAFEAALAQVGESDLHPYVIRKTLAAAIMETIRREERRHDRLVESALDDLRRLERARAGGAREAAGHFRTATLAPPRSV